MFEKEEKDKENKEGIRGFDAVEVKEISKYIQTNVPYSILEQIFPLTENIVNKVQVFTVVYRILNSAKNYVSKDETRIRLQTMLDECKGIYNILYSSLVAYQDGGFGSRQYYKKIVSELKNVEHNIKINSLIDAFLLFAEKQTFFDINKIAGIESSRKEGENVVDKLFGERSED